MEVFSVTVIGSSFLSCHLESKQLKTLKRKQPTYVLAEKIPSNRLGVYADVVEDTEFHFFFHYLKWHRNSKLRLLSSPKVSFLYSH